MGKIMKISHRLWVEPVLSFSWSLSEGDDIIKYIILSGCFIALIISCGGKPFTYVNENEIPPGPGLLTGEEGDATVYGSKSDASERPAATEENKAIEPHSFQDQQEFQEFQNWKREREAFEKFQKWKKTTKGQKEYQEFKEWQEWNEYKRWQDNQPESN